MAVYTINAFQAKAYRAYLERVYENLKAPGFRFSFETLRQLVGDVVEVHGETKMMPAPWNEVYACVNLLKQEGLVFTSQETAGFVVVKTSVRGGQQKFDGLLDRVLGKQRKSREELPASLAETAAEVA